MAIDMDTDLKTLTDEDFMAQWTVLGDEVQAYKDRLSQFSQEHQRRERERQLRNAVGDLSPEDLALLQTMEPAGIESEEAVGSDG